MSEEFEELEELMRLSREFETIELWLEHIENYDAILYEIAQQEKRLKNEHRCREHGDDACFQGT